MTTNQMIRRVALSFVGLVTASQVASAANPVVVTDGSVKLETHQPVTEVITKDIPPPSSSDNGTMTVGLYAQFLCSGGTVPILYNGFSVALSIGAYSPTGLTGGRAVNGIWDLTGGSCVVHQTILKVSGFSSDPGTTWLVSITCNGVQNTQSSSGYGYSGGIATWAWVQPFGLASKQNKNVSCTIVHN